MRENGLHTGRAILDHPDGREEYIAPNVGFIAEAVATPLGITAVLAITSEWMDRDLRALAERDQLGCAELCMLQRMTAVPDLSPWGIRVWTVQSTRARLCQFTSSSHVAGQRVIRQLALDESLSLEDLQPPRRRMPTVFSRNGTDGAAVVADVNPGAVTTPKRQPLASQSFLYTLAGGARATPTVVTHSLGVIPNCTFDSGNSNGDLSVWLAGAATSQITLCGIDISASPISGVATLYCW